MVKNIGVWICTLVLLGSGVVQASSPAIDVEPIVTDLMRPVAVTHAGDGSGRLFITLQTGKIVIYDGTQVLPTLFLDISSLVRCCGERGLLSVAFHPNYKNNGFFYVNYTESRGATVIARYTVSADPNVADPNSATILLTVSQPFSNHNGGQLQFGPDGYLYIGMGDGGSGGDPQNNGQSLRTLLGKMLRIDVDGGVPYAIPPDNPFVGPPGARDEIWALGLRNPWRFSFDRLTGDLFIADVGQGSWEEVNLQPVSSPGGENYGWRLMEGNHCFNPSTGCNDGTLIPSILEYDHSLGCSITGGYRYRGAQIPELDGTYIYGDYCSGKIWGATEDSSGGWTVTELLDTNFLISTFGEDEAGELYL
ncbi:MAG: PQQ-dependent sugar dehydrogenase, partial [Candidatus Bipolaricaulia bacterium]